jgi:hypothetical protein
MMMEVHIKLPTASMSYLVVAAARPNFMKIAPILRALTIPVH